MKSSIILILIVSISVISNYKYHSHSHSNSKKSHKVQKYKKKETPKGSQLLNVFGSNPFHNPYGPKPRLFSSEAFIKNDNGKIIRKRIRIIENLPNKES
jgi:hypothetical protein